MKKESLVFINSSKIDSHFFYSVVHNQHFKRTQTGFYQFIFQEINSNTLTKS
jgi:hypothetical protein